MGSQSLLDTDIPHPLLVSYTRHQRAKRLAPGTIENARRYIGDFIKFAQQQGLDVPTAIRRKDIENWLIFMHEHYKPHTVRTRYNVVRTWFRWLVLEGEIDQSPMELMKVPTVDEVPKDVVSEDDMRRVLAGLEKEKDWRALAVVAILYDTGMRRSELASCLIEHVNLDTGIILLPKTKSHHPRVVRISPATVRHLDRYLRRRGVDGYPNLIVGRWGPTTGYGVYEIVRNTFERYGVKATIGAHDLRHTSASHVVGHMSESEMMTLFGWKNADMARHYAAQALEAAALRAHERASPMERLKK